MTLDTRERMVRLPAHLLDALKQIQAVMETQPERWGEEYRHHVTEKITLAGVIRRLIDDYVNHRARARRSQARRSRPGPEGC